MIYPPLDCFQALGDKTLYVTADESPERPRSQLSETVRHAAERRSLDLLRIPDAIDTELLVAFRKGTEHLRSMAQKLEYPWKPDESDPRVLHNNYARNLVTCYVSKFSDLSDGLLHALKKKNYLVYALNGRAMIENVATLRYYVQYQYKPIFEKGSLSADDFRRLIEIDDKHLRGTALTGSPFFSSATQNLRMTLYSI